MLVLLDDLPDDSLGRWSALLADAARLGIAVLFLADSPAATGRLVLDAERTVTSAQPAVLAERLGGVELFGLDADETVELLGSVNEANHERGQRRLLGYTGRAHHRPAPRRQHRNAEQATPGEEPWPQTTPADVPPPEAPDRPDRPIVVEVLGPMRIIAFDQPVSTGLRARAQTLLAWALLRPEGATIDEIVDALWPDTSPDRVLKQFWHPLGDLRTYFRGPDKEALEVLEKVGEHYRPSPAEIACDLWDFQSALGDAARAGTDGRPAPRCAEAIDVYQGDLLAGSAERWVEPVRQDLHRRAVDAHLRLAELEDHAGHHDAAVAVLERIIDMDRYAEEPYRRLMALHAAHGRRDAVTATWQLLQRRLADLDVDVDEATARLYRTLVAPDPDPGAAGQPRPDPPHIVSVVKALPGLDTPARIAATCILGAGIEVAMAWRFGWSAELPAYLAFGAVAAMVTGTDLAARRIPNRIVAPAYVIGPCSWRSASAGSGSWWPSRRAAIGAALLAGFYLALGLAFPAGMGLGDVKWAGVIGLYLGYLGWTTCRGHARRLRRRRGVRARRSRRRATIGSSSPWRRS